jgi:type 1 glutamine amidotransferase
MDPKKTISRRGMIRGMGVIGSSAALGSTVFPAPAIAAPRYATAFALVGDRFHNSDYIRTSLSKTLVKDAGLSIDFTDEVTLLNADTLRHYKMVIVFRDGMLWPDGYHGWFAGYDPATGHKIESEPPIPPMNGEAKMWMQPEQGKAVRDFVERGGAGLFYHNVSHVSLSNKDFREVEGAIYTGHPEVRPFRLHITNKEHPITRGVNDFLVTDEQHYVKYEKDPKYVFMKSENADGISFGDQGTTCEAGWAYDFGKGRVCFLAPGHMISAMWNPEYEKLQKNAVNWLMKKS